MGISEINKKLSRKLATVETEMVNFSEYDDGDGNNVAHGDKSMHMAVDGGIRDAEWPTVYSVKKG